MSDKDKTEQGKEDTEETKSEKRSKKEDSEELPKSRFTGKSFIKLTCVHCNRKYLTFKV